MGRLVAMLYCSVLRALSLAIRVCHSSPKENMNSLVASVRFLTGGGYFTVNLIIRSLNQSCLRGQNCDVIGIKKCLFETQRTGKMWLKR